MPHPLFLQVAATQGMRELLAARVYATVQHYGRRSRVEHDGVLRVTIWLSWTAWLTFGIVHALIWWQIRSIVLAEMKRMKVPAQLKVVIR